MDVSVLMITFNHEKYIHQAVDSVLMQDVSLSYEIVIGEDCSTDRTRDILIDLQQTYPDKIRLLLPDRNLGMHRNLVQTLEACRGRYVALLEGDDYWTSPDKLQKQYDFLNHHPECVICFHRVRSFYEDGSHDPWYFPPQGQKIISMLEDLLVRNFMHTCSVMFRRGLAGEFPDWFYASRMADWPLHILNAQHGSIGYIDEVMADYRIHSGGVWSSQKVFSVLEDTISMLKYVNVHFNYKYDKIIKSSLSRSYFDMAWTHQKNGDLDDAKRCLARFLSTQPLNASVLLRSIHLLLAVNAPSLYRNILSVKNSLLPSLKQ